ncbi:transglutaminase-like domain-containing protein [Sphingorhabdus sp. 109]|jgi:transglutaminase-like putative cysteine protease|uniref:transglutaminase-like domain-containing protein n=1 Tax=Sphingorhabdus sp. 109 TaxID=2653173 RepID=UPI0012EF7DAF|nr:transglutaminase family protein [Sphingorhabdus sp. 109]VWX61311.1 Transglutaminase-like superfamily protein [Sphingorhabdus sp. 109]
MTHLQISADLSYRLAAPCTILVQVEAAATAGQAPTDSRIDIGPANSKTIVPAHDRIGTRLWTTQEEQLSISYAAQVAIDRADPDFAALPATDLPDLPGEAVPYLFNSLYCSVNAFDQVVTEEFAGLSGGALVAAMADYIRQTMRYGSDADNVHNDAGQSFAARKGVCRDYAHILISMARSANIPARFASTYAPDVAPQDFHAVSEVFLDGHWRLVDPTGMAKPSDMAVIGIGRDATDVSFLTAFGSMQMVEQRVKVTRI